MMMWYRWNVDASNFKWMSNWADWVIEMAPTEGRFVGPRKGIDGYPYTKLYTSLNPR